MNAVPSKAARRRPWVVHPLLAALFPLLSLYSRHAVTVHFSEVLPFLAAMVVLWGIVWLILRYCLPDPRGRGLLATPLLIGFSFFGPSLDGLHSALAHLGFSGHWNLITKACLCVLVFVVLALAIRFLRGMERGLDPVTRILNLTLVCALGFSLIPLPQKVMAGMERSPSPPAAYHAEDPDIFYIVLDAYPREDVLRELYHYDNTPFLDFLRSRGFYVAERNHANYPYTYAALASVLNMEYLDAVIDGVEESLTVPERASIRLWHNSVSQQLRERGYHRVNFSSGSAPTQYISCDELRRPALDFTELQNVFIQMTPVGWLLGRMHASFQYHVERERIRFAFEGIQTIQRVDGRPLFVTAHLMLPHMPFVFDAEGQAIDPPSPYTDWDYLEQGISLEGYRQHFLGQTLFANEQMKHTIDAILASHPSAVIVLHGDHGPRSQKAEEYEFPPSSVLFERLNCLNALHLPPGVSTESLPPGVSPVNDFRIVFNAIFNAGLPLLPDRSFYGPFEGDNYEDVTDILNAQPE